jgi:hypothetical protein
LIVTPTPLAKVQTNNHDDRSSLYSDSGSTSQIIEEDDWHDEEDDKATISSAPLSATSHHRIVSEYMALATPRQFDDNIPALPTSSSNMAANRDTMKTSTTSMTINCRMSTMFPEPLFSSHGSLLPPPIPDVPLQHSLSSSRPTTPRRSHVASSKRKSRGLIMSKDGTLRRRSSAASRGSRRSSTKNSVTGARTPSRGLSTMQQPIKEAPVSPYLATGLKGNASPPTSSTTEVTKAPTLLTNSPTLSAKSAQSPGTPNSNHSPIYAFSPLVAGMDQALAQALPMTYVTNLEGAKVDKKTRSKFLSKPLSLAAVPFGYALRSMRSIKHPQAPNRPQSPSTRLMSPNMVSTAAFPSQQSPQFIDRPMSPGIGSMVMISQMDRAMSSEEWEDEEEYPPAAQRRSTAKTRRYPFQRRSAAQRKSAVGLNNKKALRAQASIQALANAAIANGPTPKERKHDSMVWQLMDMLADKRAERNRRKRGERIKRVIKVVATVDPHSIKYDVRDEVKHEQVQEGIWI